MPRGFVKLNDGQRDWYFEWSTVVDAPVTIGMSLETLKRYVRDDFGERADAWFPETLARLERKSTSFTHDASPLDTLAVNRAGAGETCLSPEQIIASYGRREHMGRDGRCLLKGGHTHMGPGMVESCDWSSDQPPQTLARGEFRSWTRDGKER